MQRSYVLTGQYDFSLTKWLICLGVIIIMMMIMIMIIIIIIVLAIPNCNLCID